MKIRRKNHILAFTLIEMAMAISISLGLAVGLLALIGQQIEFSRRIADFQFLRDEAPQINTLFAAIISRADSYRIHTDLTSAIAGEPSPDSSGSALQLRFFQPDGSIRRAILGPGPNGERGIHYYLESPLGGVPSEPSWTISHVPTTVRFSNLSGILSITLQDEAGSEITYSGNPD
ncbi:MAG: hypothetical protein P1U81_06565 [Verrucomicrobiales bacterium]|jgi:hypothetical protein|nr:hypothetical protein [Verrucomicrobiales bacterium]